MNCNDSQTLPSEVSISLCLHNLKKDFIDALQYNQFDEALRMIDKNVSSTYSNCYTYLRLQIRLLKLLDKFRYIEQVSCIKSIQETINDELVPYGLSSSSSDFITVIVAYPCVIKSVFYEARKNSYYVKLIAEALTSNDLTYFYRLQEEFEKELIFYVASYSKSYYCFSDFDQFISFCVPYCYQLQKEEELINDFVLRTVSYWEYLKKSALFTEIKKPENIIQDFSKMTKKSRHMHISSRNKKIRRTIVDRINLRQFWRYMKAKLKSTSRSSHSDFIQKFVNDRLLPPFTISEKQFKTYNNSYIEWLFTGSGVLDSYLDYIRENLATTILFIKKKFPIEDEVEIKELVNYLSYVFTGFIRK